MPQKQAVKYGGVASFILSLAAAVFLQLNPQSPGGHPNIVKGLYAVSLMIATLAVSQTAVYKNLFGVQDGPEDKPPFESGFISNAAAANGNKIEQHFHAVAPSPLESTAPKSSEAPPVYPTFHWRFRYTKVSGLNDIWREKVGGFGYQSLVADVSADLPEAGKRVRECALYGAVKFAGQKSENTAFLNRLCWLGEPMNEMDFEVGKSATLFILCFEADEVLTTPVWKAFQCKQNRFPDHPFSRPPIPSLQDFGRMTIPVDGAPTVVISLVDANTGFVVDTKTVQLTVNNSQFEIEEISARVVM